MSNSRHLRPTHSSADKLPADKLSLVRIQENNLKNLSLDIPHDQFIAVTGISGSGKSTLAFDTIYAEGGRRYIETFSPYTRQFLDRLQKPNVDTISGVKCWIRFRKVPRRLNAHEPFAHFSVECLRSSRHGGEASKDPPR